MVEQGEKKRVDLFDVVVKRVDTGQESTELVSLTPGDKFIQGMQLMSVVDRIYPAQYYTLLDLVTSDGFSLLPFINHR